MNRKLLAGTIAAFALGSAGVAVAEGTGESTKDKPSQKQTQHEQQGSTETGQSAQGAEQGTGTERDVQQTKTGINRLDSVKLTALDEQAAKNLQTKLQELGYYKGEIDGKIGPKSRTALSQFFRDQMQLVNRGRLSEVAMTSLGFEDDDIERVRGVDEESTGERSPTRGVEEGSQGTQSGSKGVMPDVGNESEPRQNY